LSLGKTHLLNAIGHQALEQNPQYNIAYVSAQQLSSEFIFAKKNQKLDAFRRKYKSLDYMLLDDVQIFGGKEKVQEELSTLINVLLEGRKQVVLAASKPPSQIPGLIPQFRSRLEWGLLSEITMPDQKIKMRIIRKKAKDANLHIPEDAVFFLANAATDLKTLTHYMIRIESFASLYRRNIDMSTVETVISNKKLSKITIADIQRISSTFFNISLSDLLSSKKGKSFSYPRQLAMYLSRNLLNSSYKEIGAAFGNRDHSTVIYAVKRIRQQKESNQQILNDINKIQTLLS
jgi:chromosomal replication initiator protein